MILISGTTQKLNFSYPNTSLILVCTADVDAFFLQHFGSFLSKFSIHVMFIKNYQSQFRVCQYFKNTHQNLFLGNRNIWPLIKHAFSMICKTQNGVTLTIKLYTAVSLSHLFTLHLAMAQNKCQLFVYSIFVSNLFTKV